jgi:hypothetical protein
VDLSCEGSVTAPRRCHPRKSPTNRSHRRQKSFEFWKTMAETTARIVHACSCERAEKQAETYDGPTQIKAYAHTREPRRQNIGDVLSTHHLPAPLPMPCCGTTNLDPSAPIVATEDKRAAPAPEAVPVAAAAAAQRTAEREQIRTAVVFEVQADTSIERFMTIEEQTGRMVQSKAFMLHEKTSTNGTTCWFPGRNMLV